jgi:putative ABC transport system substrate-binding protein
MRRREFITLIGGAGAWPLNALAQQPSGRIWWVGFLNAGIFTGPAVASFEGWKNKLHELGYVEGQNLVIERRFAGGDFSRLHRLAEELAASRLDAIVAVTTPAVAAVQKASSGIPVVMAGVTDPVSSNFVNSLARPGGRITGLANMSGDYVTKTVELLRELLPDAKRIAVLMSENSTHPTIYPKVEAAAATVGFELSPVIAKTEPDLDESFTEIVRANCQAVIVLADATRVRIVPLAANAKLPVVYQSGQFVDVGGLISYGASTMALIVKSAVYVDKILKGADPADLPVEQPTVFELKINLNTAKSLGINIPPTLLARADEVIE